MEASRIRSSIASAGRFRAFVSYSHADADVARRLQRRLETYRVPRRLRHRVSPLGDPDGRIGPVFRDREDLPATSDLSEAVKAAIILSDALIVLCSPAAKESIWVHREIELFRSIHPDRPILTAIIRGNFEQSIPDILVVDGREPLAADFRSDGDGPRLAFLKVVAGILDVPLDELIQRDAQRRQRRTLAVTIGALALAVLLGINAIVAIDASRDAERERSTAERRRAEAEGLVEYMLTDLRQRLKAVGRLDIMTDVNRRAMIYYRDQGDLDLLSDDSLERRARVIGAMGEDAENGGDFDLAQSRYLELHRATVALRAKHPGSPERIFAEAQSENRLALIAGSRNRLDVAERRLARARRLLASIEGWGAARADWLRLSAYAAANSCATLLKRDRASRAALPHCVTAVDLNRKLIRMSPQDNGARYDIIFHYLWLAQAQLAVGALVDAKRTQYLYLSAMDELIRKDPHNMLWREQQMELYVRHAELLYDIGKRKSSYYYLILAKQIDLDLVRTDAKNAIWVDYSSRIARLLQREY